MSVPIKVSSPATREFWEIPVLFEDEHLLALEKPSGLLTSPDRCDPDRPNLMRLLHRGIAESKPWAAARGLSYLMNAHRLDFDASGVLLFAKTKPVLIALANLFGGEKPRRSYAALVQGAPADDRFEIDAKLAPHPAAAGRMRVDPKRGKRSRTVCAVRERFSGWTLLECILVTDRTHQTRIHLRYVGLPVVGDNLYGGQPLWLSRLKPGYRLKPNRSERPLLGRVALHAQELTLPHPVTGESLTITSAWPKDFNVSLKYLRQFAAQ